MSNEHEYDEIIIAAAKALGKEKFTVTDVYYEIHQRRPRGNERRELHPTGYDIRGALERNGAKIVDRWSRTTKPFYSFTKGDK